MNGEEKGTSEASVLSPHTPRKFSPT